MIQTHENHFQAALKITFQQEFLKNHFATNLNDSVTPPARNNHFVTSTQRAIRKRIIACQY